MGKVVISRFSVPKPQEDFPFSLPHLARADSNLVFLGKKTFAHRCYSLNRANGGKRKKKEKEEDGRRKVDFRRQREVLPNHSLQKNLGRKTRNCVDGAPSFIVLAFSQFYYAPSEPCFKTITRRCCCTGGHVSSMPINLWS